jgi:hypothetical protein
MDNNWRVVETDQFTEEAERLFDSANNDVRTALVWALERKAVFGQQVVGTNLQVWVIFRGGFAYLAYYSMSGDVVKLESVVRRTVPLAPGPLGLES